MFNLESSIAEWRRQMLASGIQSPVPLDELESHLREEIQNQMSSDCDESSAFTLSVNKIGQPWVLNAEFSRDRGFMGCHKNSRSWEFYASIAISFGVIFPIAIFSLCKYDLNWIWRSAGIADIVLIVLAILGCRYINTWFPAIHNQRIRRAIGLTCGLAGMAGMVIFANFILPRFSLTEGQLIVLILWGLTVMAAGSTVLAGLEEAAKKTPAKPRPA